MYYPRSFLKFILLSFLLVSLPLLYALAELLLSVDRLASQSREEVLQAAQAARTSRLFFEQATTLERIVRQQLILEDPALLEDYAKVRQEFRATGAQLATLPLEASERATLERLMEREGSLAGRFAGPRFGAGDTTALAEGYAALVDGAQSMVGASAQLTQRAIERRRRRRRARGRPGFGSRSRPPRSRSASRSCSRC